MTQKSLKQQRRQAEQTTTESTDEPSARPWAPLADLREAASLRLDPTYEALGVSWRRSLIAENATELTRTTYMQAQQRFGYFLAERGLPQRPREITRAHIEAWIVAQFEAGYKPNSVNGRFRALSTFFRWLESEDEIAISPMRRMKAPAVPETYQPVLTDEQVSAILATCNGKSFADRRDLAVLMLLFDTGMRRSELASTTLDLLNLDEQFVVVKAKGRRDRVIAFGRQTVRVLDRYLRMRASHPYAASAHLFLGQRGRMTGDGIYQTLTGRAALAGIRGIHPHLFRHTYAHLFLEAGGQESDLMAQAGWRSPQMVRKYGAILREKRALETAKRLSPADRMAGLS